MQPISLKKIFIAILGVVALVNLRDIRQGLEPFWWWFHESLLGLHNFPRGAQTAIAFMTMILVFVLLFKHFDK